MEKQEKFWARDYAEEYIERNNSFDLQMGIKAWETMLLQTQNISSVLEIGPNIGRNIKCIEKVLPDSKLSIIEISKRAYDIITRKHQFEFAENGSLKSSSLPCKTFDLVFTSGFLIHIHPDELLLNLKKIYDYSKQYILICEMFSRVPKSVHYKGSVDLLFTRDFGRFLLSHFDIQVVDYGFLWGHYYDDAGFDDANWWLFKK